MFAGVLANPVIETSEGASGRQQTLVIRQFHRPHPETEMKLTGPKAGPNDQCLAQSAGRGRGSQPAERRGWQSQPAPHESADFGVNAKEILDDRFQTFRVAVLMHQAASEKKLGSVGNTVALDHALHTQAKEASDKMRPPLFVGAVEINMFLSISPGAKEKGRKTMMKDVAEGGESRIAVLNDAVVCVLGQTKRQRAIWAEEAEVTAIEPRLAGLTAQTTRIQCGRSKIQRRALPKSHGVLRRRPRIADSRPVGEAALDQSPGCEEVELKSLRG